MSGEAGKYKILVADDSEMNRAILADMLGDEFDIIEAENGLRAVELIRTYGVELSIILLDIVMPEMDGFGVLEEMNRKGWIENIPVIMISAESGAKQIERAYELGASDFITRPFDALIVHKRVANTILLYAKQKKLVELVADQVYEAELQNNMIIDILSHVVEFRNGESGPHIRHVHILTEMFLEWLDQNTTAYHFTPKEISGIGTASALHDIGKLAIPEEILNKPGRLTQEEFEIMKTHTTVGSQMLDGLPIYQDQPLLKTARNICRWHHERYDGRGYPDGLMGEDIPIAAQVVALADVYDALTSPRVYKKAFTHEESVDMILRGECGAFSPTLMECFKALAGSIPKEIARHESRQTNRWSISGIAEETLRKSDLAVSKRTLQLLENERFKNEFFASLSDEIQFEYTVDPPTVTLTSYTARKLGLPEVIRDPMGDPEIREKMGEESMEGLRKRLRSASPEQPQISLEYQFRVDGAPRWYHIVVQTRWSDEDPPQYIGVIGKATDINDERRERTNLELLASTDRLTKLLNHASAKKKIKQRLKENPDGKYALAIFDLDYFKQANDNRGHLFGDKLLTHIAGRLRQTVRGADIVARVGGDEFLIFLEYKTDPEAAIHRIFSTLCQEYEGFDIFLSMGVARTEDVGTKYKALFHAADSALYSIKRSGRGLYRFYDSSMADMLSAISPIGVDHRSGKLLPGKGEEEEKK